MINIDDNKKVDAHILVNLQEKHRRLQDSQIETLDRFNKCLNETFPFSVNK